MQERHEVPRCPSNAGCRFVPPTIAKKYDFDLPEYQGIDQIVEVGPSGEKL